MATLRKRSLADAGLEDDEMDDVKRTRWMWTFVESLRRRVLDRQRLTERALQIVITSQPTIPLTRARWNWQRLFFYASKPRATRLRMIASNIHIPGQQQAVTNALDGKPPMWGAVRARDARYY